MAPPDKPPPLPLAPDRAAVSNRISLLLASQSSVLKTMNQSSSAAAAKRQRPQHHAPDEEALFKEYARPNEGVGYVADSAKTKLDEAAKEDRMLRGRLLSKRKDANAGRRGARPTDDDEEDDEGGRSSLGKRKRPKRVVETVEEAVVEETANETPRDDMEVDQVDDKEAHKDSDEKDKNQSTELVDSDLPHNNHLTTEVQAKKKKKKKRKNKKNSNEGES